MVSLFDISLQKPLWSHLSTGVPTLDLMLGLQNDAILDWQTVPANRAFSAMLCSLLVSHLASLELLRVVIIETLNPFPWLVLKLHPSFDADWIDLERILTYSLPSFAQIYSFFGFSLLPKTDPGMVLVIITNFHEVLEAYRLQLAATHEELLLKHQIDKNRCFLDNIAKISEEGVRNVKLPSVPAIARDNPYTKAQTHINGLLLMISEYTFKNAAVAVLCGHLEPKYTPISRIESVTPSSTDTSFQSSQAPGLQAPTQPYSLNKEPSRLILKPVLLGATSHEKTSLSEGKITARLVFYNDWFHKSPFYQREAVHSSSRPRFFVSVVKVYNLSGLKNINEPVYFHYGHIPSAKSTWLVDLLAHEQLVEEEELASLIQTSITSTQAPNREVGLLLAIPYREPETRRKIRKISILSSPPYAVSMLPGDISGMSASEGENEVNNDGREEFEQSEESEASENNEDSEEDEKDEDSGESDENNDEDSVHTSDEADESASPKSSTSGGNIGNIERLEIVDEDEESQTSSSNMRILIGTEHLYIEGSDVELTGTLLEDMDNSQPDWMMRHS